MPDRGKGADLKPAGQDLLSAIVLADSFTQVRPAELGLYESMHLGAHD